MNTTDTKGWGNLQEHIYIDEENDIDFHCTYLSNYVEQLTELKKYLNGHKN